ncbi:translin-associated protein X [Amyelois transitella]|uniref:translin-associated protein X n=1 Tax=Amyelois transitella TaxID=680683 RepID=UPI00067BD39D|nr:translin-associated protein X [Amyelois transitella]
MSGRGRYRDNRNRKHKTLSSVARETAASIAADSPVLAMFLSAAQKLNERQDRHERLIKLSRDITIESKRIIFLLHSGLTAETTKKAVTEAKERIQKLINGPIRSIAIELENSPAYLHSRAVTAGFQEFIEAWTLCTLMEKKEIISFSEVQQQLTYKVKDSGDTEEERAVVAMLPHTDYMLGLADLTGELMRRAINSLSSGERDECFHTCQVVRDLYTGYIGLYGMGKELCRKTNITRSNVYKVEGAVYALSIRGEAPPTLILAATQPAHLDWETHDHSDDEGFY